MYYHLGTGFIWTNNTIVTAAHVVYGQVESIKIYFTLDAHENDGFEISIERIVIHPDYVWNEHLVTACDIAKVILKIPLVFNRTVDRIEIVHKTYKYKFRSEKATAFGYMISENQFQLRRIDLEYISGKECKEYYKANYARNHVTFEKKLLMCLGFYNNTDIQHIIGGDSGSPIVYQNKVIGIIAGGSKNGPDIITLIAPFYDFLMGIKKNSRTFFYKSKL